MGANKPPETAPEWIEHAETLHHRGLQAIAVMHHPSAADATIAAGYFAGAQAAATIAAAILAANADVIRVGRPG